MGTHRAATWAQKNFSYLRHPSLSPSISLSVYLLISVSMLLASFLFFLSSHPPTHPFSSSLPQKGGEEGYICFGGGKGGL